MSQTKFLSLGRLLISALFLLSAIAKLYPSPMYAITKIFEGGQLIPMGFSEDMAPYVSRIIIGFEFFIALALLQRNYIKRIIIPGSIILVSVFTLHLSYQFFLGNSENCGCFGELIPMTPFEAIIKNVITILLLVFLYKYIREDKQNNFRKLLNQFLIILLLMFAFIPIQKEGKNKRVSAFSQYVESEIDINSGKKILCFFDAGCEHCMDAAKSLASLSNQIEFFPEVHIVFSDLEEEKIPDFFKYAGQEYSYQVLPFYNEDDEINSYLEILGYEYENPAIIFLNDGNQIRFYDGTGPNEYNEQDLKKLLE
mgnify:CR=1 FL=1